MGAILGSRRATDGLFIVSFGLFLDFASSGWNADSMRKGARRPERSPALVWNTIPKESPTSFGDHPADYSSVAISLIGS
ncbi:hypothetical protein D3C72_2477140 [compost metagenome]